MRHLLNATIVPTKKKKSFFFKKNFIFFPIVWLIDLSPPSLFLLHKSPHKTFPPTPFPLSLSYIFPPTPTISIKFFPPIHSKFKITTPLSLPYLHASIIFLLAFFFSLSLISTPLSFFISLSFFLSFILLLLHTWISSFLFLSILILFPMFYLWWC